MLARGRSGLTIRTPCVHASTALMSIGDTALRQRTLSSEFRPATQGGGLTARKGQGRAGHPCPRRHERACAPVRAAESSAR
jgi:hypothetical protein